jgi:hypothetical protein
MTREDIIERMGWLPSAENGMSDIINRIERIVNRAVEAEREAICPIVYGLCISDNNAQEIVNAIRARGSK